jgi:hypothetical protein
MGRYIEGGWGRTGAILLGVLATVLILLAIASFYGYVPPSWVDNLTSSELGVFAFLAALGAVWLEVANGRGSQVGGSFYRGGR